MLIAVSPVNSQIVWAAGTGGTYVVTTDGGSTWKSGVVPGAESLQFRDVQGVSDQVAYLPDLQKPPPSNRSPAVNQQLRRAALLWSEGGLTTAGYAQDPWKRWQSRAPANAST